MPLISTKIHGAGDYAGGLMMLAAPRLLPMRDRRAQAMVAVAGAGVLGTGAFTDYELGLQRRLPMPVHLLLDAAAGGLMLAGAVSLRGRRGVSLFDWLPHTLIGAGQIVSAALTERQPADRGDGGGAAGDSAVFAPGGEAPMPQAPTGVTDSGPAAHEPPGEGGTQVAPAPLETPGPSVTPPVLPESEAERAERIDANLAGAGSPQTGDTLVAQEEAAAAAEAASIGGMAPRDADDPALDPVYQAGGGEEEGYEAAEADLIENATHGEGHAQPERDAIAPEVESDLAGAVYAEADTLPSTEVVADPEAGADDPAEGPGLSAERGTGPKPDHGG